MGDVFFRWDGFSFYASFSEFLPSVALITVLWSFTAVITSVLLWISLNATGWLFSRSGLKIKTEHLMVFIFSFVILGVLAWVSRQHFFYYVNITRGFLGISLNLKLLMFLYIAIISVIFTFLFRNHAGRWITSWQDRITPLVYIFGICVILSIPIVIYHSWIKKENKVQPQKFIQTHASDQNRPNILFITFDAMSARDMSVYGYHRPTTPFIAEWSKTASVFSRLEAASNYTRSSMSSLLTGKRIWTHQIYHSDQRSSPTNIQTENIALLLKENGYFNIAIMTSAESSEGAVKKYFNIYPLFSEFTTAVTLSEYIDNLLYKIFGNGIRLYDWYIKEDFILSSLTEKIVMNSSSITSKRPQLAFNKFLQILDNGIPTPYFAWIHLFPPHWPYLPPEPYKGIFDSSSEMRTLQSQASINNGDGTLSFVNAKQPLILRARYDEFIRYCDEQFKEFITKLENKYGVENTVIIFSADHGESFEHNYFTHGGPHLYEAVTNIPFIVKEFGHPSGRFMNELVDQIDIPATILDLAHIEIPPWMEGRSIVPLLRETALPSKAIFSMNFENNRTLGHILKSGTVAVWKGDYKLIYSLDTDESLLFDLKQDPDELNNLIDKKPEISQNLIGILHGALNEANERISRGE